MKIVSQYNIFALAQPAPQYYGGQSVAAGVAQRLAGTAPIITDTVVGQITLDEYSRVTIGLSYAQLNQIATITEDLAVLNIQSELSAGIDTSQQYTKQLFESIVATISLSGARLVKVI